MCDSLWRKDHETNKWRRIDFGPGVDPDSHQVACELDDDGAAVDGAFPSNSVTTSKYTYCNFICKNTWEQLHRFANVWFLILSALMWVGYNTDLFPGLINPWPTLGTLLVMMAMTAVSNALDDCARCNDDRTMNGSRCTKFIAGRPVDASWEDIRVGDLLYVKSDEQIPADMVCLASAGLDGLSYVSTANLDGETNLKAKTAVEETQDLMNPQDGTTDGILWDKLDGHWSVEAEPPSDNIREFSGRMISPSSNEQGKGLLFDNLLLRGTALKNTPWCVGLTVYTGPQTRIMKNSKAIPLKAPSLDKTINVAVAIMIFIQTVLALISMIGREVTKNQYNIWYLQPAEKYYLPSPIAQWLAFFLLYSNLVPVSLFATIEACNLVQSKFIDKDRHMYDPETKLYALARSRNLCQEPGQVDYIFSDKTGTLTQNVMELKQVTIKGTIYGELKEGQRGFSGGDQIEEALKGSDKEAVQNFLEVLAVDHTVVIDDSGKYEAESPDEAALVDAVGKLGYQLTERSGPSMKIDVRGEGVQQYQVLCVNAFDSTRKRMSSLVQKANQEYVLLIKGADNVMLERAAAGFDAETLSKDLYKFSCEGLRTLVFGHRKLSSNEAQRLVNEYEKAYASNDRKAQLDIVAEHMERDITILGATAIEDKLQDGVAKTIENIRKAGIKLWVLTGDKLETARNIGFSCKVLSTEMDIQVLEDLEQEPNVLDKLVTQAQQNKTHKVTNALMVTGLALTQVKDGGHEDTILELAELCSVVIACRVSPAQKAEMVRLVSDGVKVQHRSNPISLAIGDGANDVPMIQEAKIGVGIYGKEGRQAVNNSDIAIAQFRFLERLLLIHGRWNYLRIARVVLYTFWRNAALVLSMFYYTWFTGFTAIPLFEDMVRGAFNVLTVFPTILTGIFDRDYDADTMHATPELYETGRENRLLNWKEVVETNISAFIHSMILLLVMRVCYEGLDITNTGDVWTFGTIVYSCLMVQVLYRCVLITMAWNWMFWLGIVLCGLMFVAFLVVYCSLGWSLMNMIPMYGVFWKMAGNTLFWFCLFTVPAIAATLDLFKRYLWTLRCIKDSHLDDAIARGKAAERENYPHLDCQGSRQVNGEIARQVSSSYDINHPGYTGRHHTAYGATMRKLTQPGPDYQSLSRSDRSDSGSELESEDDGEECHLFQQSVTICWSCLSESPPGPCKPWLCACTTTLCMSIVLLVLGLLVLFHTRAIAQVRIRYDGLNVQDSFWNRLHGQKAIPHHCPVNVSVTAPTPCIFSVTLDKDMKPPILVFYKLAPFYQNYADYFKSVYWPELVGKDVAGQSKYTTSCKPSLRLTPQGERISPCGMQAKALFNDTFRILNYPIRSDNVAWKTDMSQFKNPSDYPGPNVSWLYQRFPTVINKSTGVKNDHFAVWMRPDAYPEVRKPYGWVDSPLTAGQNLSIEINASYPISDIGVVKELIITTTSPYGGRDEGFGWFLLAFSVICCLVSMCICCLEGIESLHTPSRSIDADDDEDNDEDGSE